MKLLFRYLWHKFQQEYLNQWMKRYRQTVCYLWDHNWKEDEATFGFASRYIKYATGNRKCARCGETEKKEPT